MKLKPNYFTIPLLTFTVAYLGRMFTTAGIQSGWYETITKPAWTPSGSTISLVWTTIFVLTAISALIVWNKCSRDTRFKKIIAVFILNGFLNFSWSFLFFGSGFVGFAVIWSGLIALTVGLLIYWIWSKSRLAAILLIPYLAWVCFATYLNYVIFTLN
ncbi:MAG: TspO/MBR family protein [Candidatus Magasanikbacteria bacterium]